MVLYARLDKKFKKEAYGPTKKTFSQKNLNERKEEVAERILIQYYRELVSYYRRQYTDE